MTCMRLHHVSTDVLLYAAKPPGLFKGLPKPTEVGHLGERFALLFALTDGFSRKAKRENG